MAKMFDADASPQDAGFNALRIGISFVAEYEPMISDADSPLAWAIADLRSVIADLVDALTHDQHESIRHVTIELLNLIGDLSEET